MLTYCFLLCTHAQEPAKRMGFGVFIVRNALPAEKQQQMVVEMNTMFQKLSDKHGSNSVKVRGKGKCWYHSVQAVSEPVCTCFYGCCCWRNNAKSTRP